MNAGTCSARDHDANGVDAKSTEQPPLPEADELDGMGVPQLKSWIRRGLAKLKGCMEMGE